MSSFKEWKDTANIDIETYEYVDNILDNLKDMRKIYSLAIPSDQIMFNVMRACVGITNIRYLWFYQEKLTYNE